MIATTLTIITRRHPNRTGPIYREHRTSIEQQDSSLFEVVELHGSRSVAEANRALAKPLNGAAGAYVMVLDDDDKFTHPDVVRLIADEVDRLARPAWIMLRGRVGDYIFPRPWGAAWRPIYGTIPSFSLVVRRGVWDECRAGWNAGGAADYHFSKRLWEAGHRPHWVDDEHVHVRTIRVSRGRPDPATSP